MKYFSKISFIFSKGTKTAVPSDWHSPARRPHPRQTPARANRAGVDLLPFIGYWLLLMANGQTITQDRCHPHR